MPSSRDKRIKSVVLHLSVIHLLNPVFDPKVNDASVFADSQIINSPDPYDFPVLDFDENGEEYSPFPMRKCNGIVLEETTIDQLQRYMDSRILSSVKLATCYLERIQQTDDFIRAIMELNPDTMQIAAALDLERSRGQNIRGPLTLGERQYRHKG